MGDLKISFLSLYEKKTGREHREIVTIGTRELCLVFKTILKLFYTFMIYSLKCLEEGEQMHQSQPGIRVGGIEKVGLPEEEAGELPVAFLFGLIVGD